MKKIQIFDLVKFPVLVFILTFLVTDLLSIKGIRPDFIFIYVLYYGIKRGSFNAVLTGFFLGLAVDLSGVGTYFGLSSLLYSLTGYLAGYMKGQYSRVHPVVYHSSWIILTAVIFFISCFIRFNILFETSLPEFLSIWLYTSLYTLFIMGVLQVLLPVNEG